MNNPQPQATPEKKRRRRSPDDIMAKNFLKSIIKPVKGRLYLAWLLDVISVVVLVGQSYVLVRIFGEMLAKVLGGDSSAVIDSQSGFWVDIAILFGCMLARLALAYARDFLLSEVGILLAEESRQKLFAKLAQLGMARRYFGSDGVLASKIIDEPDFLVGYARFYVQKISAVSTPAILLLVVAYHNLTTALILLATAPLVPLFMAIIGIATARKSREQMDALAQLGGRFLDWIRGSNTLERLGAADVAILDIKNSSESYRKRTMNVLKVAFLNSAVLEFLSALSVAAVAIYLGFGLMGKPLWSQNGVSIEYASAFFIMLLVPEFYAPLRRLGAEYHIAGQAMACAKAVAPILSFKNSNTGRGFFDLQNAPSFHLQNVAAFGDDGRVKLATGSLTFKAGKLTALVGASGAGKSTVLQIIMGFGEYVGDVVITDKDKTANYRDLDVAKLRLSYGYLSQLPPLLPLSIAQNLRLANPNATDGELEQVLKDVAMWQVVSALPNGINTQLAERGGGLSGGQAQRLAIAQLLLQNAKVWLLDEPTEHLDEETASHIKALLCHLAKDKTVIWVTHDTSGVAFDEILSIGERASDRVGV